MKKLSLKDLGLTQGNVLSIDEKKQLKGGEWYCEPWDPYCCPSEYEWCQDHP